MRFKNVDPGYSIRSRRCSVKIDFTASVARMGYKTNLASGISISSKRLPTMHLALLLHVHDGLLGAGAATTCAELVETAAVQYGYNRAAVLRASPRPSKDVVFMSSLALLLSAVVAVTPSSTSETAVTYTKQIAPILWKNCAGCHRPGEVGPFPLLSYEDAAKRADFLASITSDRRMPPWKAEPDFGRFHDERRLNESEIAMLASWAAAGAPQGDPKDLPEPPKFVEGWTLGQPDLVLEMPDAFTVPASGRDIYQCFVIPIPMTENKTVAAVEFRPGNRSVVHHAILYLDANGAARKRDESEDGPGYRSFGGPGVLPTGGLGGWAPGAMPRRLPEGTGKFLRRGSDLVLQIHYHPDGKIETDRSTVGIYFTKQPATTLVGGLAIHSRGLNIPPDEKHYQVTAESDALPVDVNVLGVAPHMHLLGRKIKVTASTPAGKTVPLVWIKDWDFNWQGQYAFEKPVRLPKGSVIHVEAEYDNSTDNPFNPNSPPKRVHWGEQTTDEMCLVSVQLTTDSMADLRAITRLKTARLGGALAGGVDTSDLDGLNSKGSGSNKEERLEAMVDSILENGFDIPAKAQDRLRIFDTDGDNRMSRKEFDAIPPAAQQRIRDAIREKVRTALGG
jgi:mono/diheme cytochrome c family protein